MLEYLYPTRRKKINPDITFAHQRLFDCGNKQNTKFNYVAYPTSHSMPGPYLQSYIALSGRPTHNLYMY